MRCADTDSRRNRTAALLLALALTVALAGCGSKTEEVDVAALAAELKEKVEFVSGEMKELTADTLSNYVDLPEGTKTAFYMGTGLSAEEIIAVQCANEKDAAALKTNVEHLLKNQIDREGAYHPEVIPRLENAVLIQQGTCVVLCVTDDADTAEQIIRGVLG